MLQRKDGFRPWKRGVALPVALAALVGCHALPAAGPVTPPAAGLAAEAAWHQRLVVEVDMRRGLAFERSARHVQAVAVQGAVRLAAEFPRVSHDAATGRTTVTMQLTNAGDSLTYLKCQVGGDRKVLSHAWPFNTSVARAGATQTIDLQFENPGGGSFNVYLDFEGILQAQGALTVTPGTTPAPSASPTPTPTATPTSAPSATPTPIATPTPAPTGGLSASASSTYGSLTPERAIDSNLATQWSNDGYQAPEAHLTLDTGAVRALSRLEVKMTPQSGGSFYRLEVSNDGATFTPVTGNLTNTSWNLEAKPLPAGTSGRYLRIRFFNDPASPMVRFSVFEARLGPG